MTELREIVRNDILRAAKEETHRRVEEAHQVSAQIPAVEEVVAAVVKGLQEANDVTVEVTKDVAKSVRAVVRDIIYSDAPGSTERSPSSVNEAPSAPHVSEAHVPEAYVSEAHVPEAHVSEPATVDDDGECAAKEHVTFSIGTAARQAAATACDDSDDRAPAEEMPRSQCEPLEETSDLSATECPADDVASESFVMVGEGDVADDTPDGEGDNGSSISLVMPEPDVDGVSQCSTLEDNSATSVEAQEMVTPELTYHQKAAAVSSSKTIDHLFTLFDMGFTDFDANAAILRIYDNNLEKTVAQLCEREEAR